MKATQFKFGGAYSTVEIPKPTPANDEVLVKVIYSALDTAHDACINKEMMGYFTHALKEPLYLGYHYSGIIEATGSDVNDIAKGAEVFGHLQYEPSQVQGSLAEYITVKRSDCAIKPSNVPHATAAASTTEAITALQAIRDFGGFQKGQRVLINGAGGGVGSAAVQIAKALGASHITAICGTKDVAQVRSWGADRVLDRTTSPNYVKNLVEEEAQYDVILDAPNMLPPGGTRLLAPKGTIVNTIPTLTFLWNKIKFLFRSKNAGFVECHSKEEDLALIGKWLDEGDLTIPIDSTFPIKEMDAAMKKQAGKKKGRVVIKVADGWK
ncbi:furan-3-one reductase [Seminavis robusta]|uniref:Furan-3-one reductase n=1 Tax=Seminavis robusta TaxID=568900 RepID=A0A9N8DZX0_9STRA|nr:furan-3-one reductase [Seminavis robusta]|eukprot:Sro512_g157550.1 furan-3-one reductase (324) ;mRNA; f:630-1601